MIEITILIPIVRNSDRKTHSNSTWDYFQGRLIDQYGGYTEAEIVKGTWRDQHGRDIVDDSRQFRVAVEASKEDSVYDLLREVKPQFDQVCIYVAVTSEHAHLV